MMRLAMRGACVAAIAAVLPFAASSQPQDSGRYQQFRPGGGSGGGATTMKLKQVWSKDFMKGYKITATFNSTDIRAVLRIFYEQTGLNFIITEAVRGTVTGQFNNVTALEALVTVLRVNNLYFIEEGSIVRVVPPDEYKEDIIKKYTVTRVYDMNQATPKTLLEALTPVLTDGVGKAVIDAKSNKILITDLKDNFEQIELVIREFSEPGKQVYIDIKVVSITLGHGYEHGINWSVLGVGNYMTFSSLFDPSGDAIKIGGIRLGVGKATSTDGKMTGQGLLSLISTMADTRVLTSPKIVAAHGEKARILIGKNVPYISKISQNQTSGISESTVGFIDAGIKVEVTPTIGKDDSIRMAFKVENSDASLVDIGGSSKAPLKITTEAESFIVCENGALVVIGGLFENTDAKARNKLPLLGDIPLIGEALFSWSSTTSNRREIAIFIQPTVVSGKSSKVRDSHKDVLGQEK